MKDDKPFKLDRPDDYVPFSDPRWTQPITAEVTDEPRGPITEEQLNFSQEGLEWFKKNVLKNENAKVEKIK